MLPQFVTGVNIETFVIYVMRGTSEAADVRERSPLPRTGTEKTPATDLETGP